ncbi:MAG TPA: MarR family transcriptional regulator [Rhodoblastus sp.]|nr:MarR family transcriptional regulator [Rhodoblastus sp.]
MFDLARFLPFHINRTGARLAAAFGDELARSDLTVPMWRVLAALWHGGEQKAGDLMVATSIEQSTLSRLVTAMEKRGLLTRRRSESDARTVVVALTAEGRKLTKDLIPYALRNERIALRGFSEEEVDQLLKMLSRIYENAADLKL